MSRSYLLDNSKYILMFFVVFGHTLEPLIHSIPTMKIVFSVIYSFHMPAFVIISGMLSKSTLNADDLLKITKNTIIPFLIFTTLYETFHYLIEGNISNYAKNLQPYWIMWFLVSLFIWRITLPIFLKFRAPLVISLVIAIIAGYFNTIGYFIGLSRTIYFFPFFIFGSKLSPNIIYRINTNIYFKYIAVVVIILNILFFTYFNGVQYKWLYGSYSYKDLDSSGLLAASNRSILYIFSFFTAMSILCLIPNKELHPLIKGKNSLFIYIWHGFFIKLIVLVGLLHIIEELPSVIMLIALFLLSFFLTTLLSSNFVKKYTQHFILYPANNILLNKN